MMGYSPAQGLVTSAALLVHHARIYGEPMARIVEFIKHLYVAYDMPEEMWDDLIASFAEARAQHEKETKH